MTNQCKPPFYDDLKAQLRIDEGTRLRPYRCTAGKLTIGVGRNLEDTGIDEAEATFMFARDVDRTLAELESRLPWYRDLAPDAACGLANMLFNLGWPRLSGFKKMLAALELGDGQEAARQALDSRWAEQVGDRAKRIAKLLESA
ncbi:MAG: lysozyme [Pseudomonadota bacterium]